MTRGELGCIVTPRQGNRPPESCRLVADNGRFGKGWPGPGVYRKWLGRLQPLASRVTFAVAPDVPFDMAGTLACSAPWMPVIRALGFPVALAAQNGAEHLKLPWDEFDALFIGGDNEWKLGRHADAISAEARARGKHVHMGRVNSLRRLKIAARMGCDSADGTLIAFGPDKNLPQVLKWQKDGRVQQKVLW
jgi:hypothetical protein